MAVFKAPLSAIHTPCNPQTTLPAFASEFVQKNLAVIVPAFHALGNATLNVATSSEEPGSKSNTGTVVLTLPESIEVTEENKDLEDDELEEEGVSKSKKDKKKEKRLRIKNYIILEGNDTS